LTYSAQFDAGRYGAMLADSLSDVTADLRTIDLVDLVSFIRLGSHTAIEDLIHSSVELFFKQGSLISAWTACVDMAWESPPLVTLGMEFRHPVVSVFFDLLLRGPGDRVVVRGILFEEMVADAGGGLRLLADAIAESRLPCRTAARGASQTRLPSPGRGLSQQ